MILVPHGPLPGAPPHPAAEPINLAAIILTSTAAPQLNVHSVSAEGGALCTAILGCWGLNLDCGDAPVFGASHDLNLNSVKTSPSLGDYVAALLSAALNMLYAWGPGKIISTYITTEAKLAQVVLQAIPAVALSIEQTVLDAINSVIDRLPEVTSNEYESYILSVIGQCVKAEMLAANSWRVAVNADAASASRLMRHLQALETTRGALLDRMPMSLSARFDRACAQSSLPEPVIAALDKVRQVRDGSLRFVLPAGVGSALIVDDVSDDEIRCCLHERLTAVA